MTRGLGISLRAVSVQRGDQWALREITLELGAGERWALIGPNGAGKTQLLKLLATDVWPTPTGREARIYRSGRRTIDLMEAKRRIAYLGAERQDQYARHGWDLRVCDLIATGLHGTDLLLRAATRAELARVRAVMRDCGLSRLALRRFLSLSYGQKRIALLARAVVQRTDWLLLDEFYNGLDARHRRRVNAILKTVRKRGGAWIVAAHRAGDVPPGTSRSMELTDGRLSAVKPFDARVLARLERGAARRPTGRGPRARRAAGGELLLRLERVDLYVDYRPVLRDVNWELRKGQHWSVTGANGAGKSSFLKLLYGDLSPALGGAIERTGCPAGTPIAEWKRRTAYLSPELQTDYLVDVRIADLVMSGRYGSIGLADEPTPGDRRVAARWLRFFDLTQFAQRRPRELSYGQLRRALMARAFAANARIVLLDEPLTGLDPEQRAAMKKILEGLTRLGTTLVIAVHHPEDLPRGMTHALHLHKLRATASELVNSDGVGGTVCQ